MKTCSKCFLEKNEDNFFRKKTGKNGLTARCKKCIIEDTSKWAENNREKSKEIKKRWVDRNKNSSEYLEKRRKIRKVYREKNKEQCLEKERERNDKLKKNGVYYYKRSSQNKLRVAILNGTIIKPKECQVCKIEKKLDGHHHDYEKPYDVIWCCRYCHSKFHK